MASLGARRIAFFDADDLSRAPACGSCRASPRTSELNLSGLALQTGCSTPLAVLGCLPAEAAWLLLPLEGRSTPLLGGRTPEPHGVAVFGAGADYELANRQDACWGLIVLPAEIGSVLSLSRRSVIRQRGSIAWLTADPAAWTRAALLMQDVAEVMVQDPGVFQVEAACCSLRVSVLDACHELLARSHGGQSRPSSSLAPQSLRCIVRTADDYIMAHSAGAV